MKVENISYYFYVDLILKSDRLMSSTKELLKFLFDYLKIYKSASSPTVAKWRQGDLNNALKWSGLCEEIYAKIKNKKSYQKLLNDLSFFKEHWKIEDSESVTEIFADAKNKLKKVNIFKLKFFL